MRRYETTFIVNPQADDAAIDRQVMAVADLIKNDGGQILNERRIGTRRLAYPIAGLVQGFFASILFDAENTVLPRLERLYKLEEPYIRHLTIRYEGQLPASEEEAAPGVTGERAKPVSPAAADKAASAKPAAADSPAPVVEKPAGPELPAEAEKPVVMEPALETPMAEKPAVTEPLPETPADPAPTEAAKPPVEPVDPADDEL